MLSKKIRLRRLNKIIATSVLMGACLIVGSGQDASATGFKGFNSGASGARRSSTGSITGSSGLGSSGNFGGVRRSNSAGNISSGSGGLGSPSSSSRLGRGNATSGASIASGSGSSSSGTISGSGSGTSSSKNRMKVDILTEMVVQYSPKKSGDLNARSVHDLLLKQDPDSIEVGNGNELVYKYVNSKNGTEVKMIVDTDTGNIIKSTTITENEILHNNFRDGWFQRKSK